MLARLAMQSRLHVSGLNVATCGVANATGFGPLTTNFSHVVASLATTISTYYFIFINFFISYDP